MTPTTGVNWISFDGSWADPAVGVNGALNISGAVSTSTTRAETGTPPETKIAWDASAVGALGVAWTVSSSAPGLQVWVTNMDPSSGGQCSVDECAIDGPPDGRPSTVVGFPDQMLFSSMVKDDWGGAGTSYSFSSASILTLQFKLASVVSGATSYDFCIAQIGIVR